MKLQQVGFLSRGGVGDLFNPGNEKFWLGPGDTFVRGYNIVVNGCPVWAFGESTGVCNFAHGNPTRVVYHKKDMILRDLTIWCAGPGRLYLKDLKTGVTMMKWYLKDPATVLEIPLGPLGVNMGFAPYFHWISQSAASNQKVWIAVAYDIQ